MSVSVCVCVCYKPPLTSCECIRVCVSVCMFINDKIMGVYQ